MACCNGVVKTQFVNQTGEDIILKIGVDNHFTLDTIRDGEHYDVSFDMRVTSYEEYHVYVPHEEASSKVMCTLEDCRTFLTIYIVRSGHDFNWREGEKRK